MNTISTLAVRLDDLLVGYLTHYPDEKTIFVVDESYIEYGARRPMLSLSMARPGDDDVTQALLSVDGYSAQTARRLYGRIRAGWKYCALRPLHGRRDQWLMK